MVRTCLALTLGVSLLAFATNSAAQLTVSTDLGVLTPGVVNLIGDTADGTNNTDTYLVPFPGDFSDANYGNELVYEFTTTEPTLLSAFARSVTADPDFFFLDSLSVVIDEGKRIATGQLPNNGGPFGPSALFFLDNPPETTSYGLLDAGTYYLSATSFLGFDGDVTPGNATFDIDLILDAVVAPDAIDLGVIATEDSPLTLDTRGSSIDTAIGLFDEAGFLIAQNDDIGFDDFDSELVFADGLPEGRYYVAIGSTGATFGDGFFLDPAFDEGGFALNYGVGSVSGTLAAGTFESYAFTVAVPEPSGAVVALMVTASAACPNRQRRRRYMDECLKRSRQSRSNRAHRAVRAGAKARKAERLS